MREFLRKLGYYLRRRQLDTELAEEMAHHRALSGARQFGNLTRLTEESRAVWTWVTLERIARDLRHSTRQLRRAPGFSAVAILSLTLGTGANAAIFQILNALQLRALPVERAEDLVEVEIAGGNRGFGLNSGWNSLTYPLWEQIRDHQEGLSSVFAWAPSELQVGTGDRPRAVRGAWVSGETFATLGITAVRGRLLGSTDDRPGCEANLVIGYGYWQREFGGRESVIGSRIVVGSQPFTVVGVTPQDFFGIEVGRNVDVLLPFCAFAQWDWLLLGIAGLVLLIACANLAHLTLARADAYGREMAVRMAIGASRTQVILQRLWESVLIAGAGTMTGLALAVLLSRGLVQFLSTGQNVIDLDLRVDWRVLAYTFAIGAAACLCFGLSTAVYCVRERTIATIASSGRGVTMNRRRFSFQRLLIPGQIAISLTLVVSSVLLVRTFQNLRTLDAGFRQQGVVFHDVDFRAAGLGRERVTPVRQEILTTLRALPGIESASTSTHLPLSGRGWSLSVRIPGSEAQGSSQFTWISPEYFSTMEIPILAGRDLTDVDTTAAPRVLLVNETFVRQFLAGAKPIGARVQSLAEPNYPEALYEVIGVVADTKYKSLREDVPPIAYAPDAQQPSFRPAAIITRASVPTAEVNRTVREVIARVHPGIAVTASTDLRAQTLDRLARERMLAWLSALFGGIAMTIAAIGLYGVVGYMVAGRRNEIGIRLALGATRGGVVRMIVQQVVILLVIGVAFGAAMTLELSKAAGAVLFGLEPGDPVTLAASAAMLTAIGVGASLVPAWRAARMHPVMALRQD